MALLFLIAKKSLLNITVRVQKKIKIINILDNELVKNSDIIKEEY